MVWAGWAAVAYNLDTVARLPFSSGRPRPQSERRPRGEIAKPSPKDAMAFVSTRPTPIT
jgi:hypothetical protein